MQGYQWGKLDSLEIFWNILVLLEMGVNVFSRSITIDFNRLQTITMGRVSKKALGFKFLRLYHAVELTLNVASLGVVSSQREKDYNNFWELCDIIKHIIIRAVCPANNYNESLGLKIPFMHHNFIFYWLADLFYLRHELFTPSNQTYYVLSELLSLQTTAKTDLT